MEQHVTTDWDRFDPVAYLEEYYSDTGDENLALLRFLAEAFQGLPPGGLLLDFGGGPTIYPLISAAARVDEIHFSDYLEANIGEVRRWLSAQPDAFDWAPFVATALHIEAGVAPTPAEVAEREAEIRKKVTRLIRCDASRNPPIDGAFERYDVLVTNFCAESATSDRSQWQASVSNIVSLLKPGGRLIMSALRGATSYAVGPRFFPAVDVSEEDLVELLEDSYFPRKFIDVRSVPADRVTREYDGLIMAIAQKRAFGPEVES